MGHRNNQLNMSHAFAPDLFLRNFHPAAVADNSLVADTFVLATMALPVFHRTKDAFAKQPIAFRFVSPVIDGLRL